MGEVGKIVATIIIVSLIYVAYALAGQLLGSEWALALAPWVVLFGLLGAYGAIHSKMSQKEKGIKAMYKTLVHLSLGWVKHWRLIVAVVLIGLGLWCIGVSQRWYLYEKVTGYKYLLQTTHGYALTGIGVATKTEEVAVPVTSIPPTFTTKFITYVSGVSYKLGEFLTGAVLYEFPVTTHFQAWFLDMGYVLIGLTLIVLGLIFGLYHGVLANNKLLETCGVHTAKYYVNYLRMHGYEVPKGYEEALAEFYKTGKADRLRKFE